MGHQAGPKLQAYELLSAPPSLREVSKIGRCPQFPNCEPPAQAFSGPLELLSTGARSLSQQTGPWSSVRDAVDWAVPVPLRTQL